MPDTSRALEAAAWAAAEGIASAEQRAMLEADPVAWRLMLERLMDETEDNLDAVSTLEGPERAQVVGDIEAELERLEAAYDLLLGVHRQRRPRPHPHRRPHRRDPPPGVLGGGLDRRVGGWPRPRRPPERRPGRPARGPRRPEPRLGGPRRRRPAQRSQGGGPLDPGRGGARLARRRGRRRPGRRGRRRRQRPLARPRRGRRGAARRAWAASSPASARTATPRAR